MFQLIQQMVKQACKSLIKEAHNTGKEWKQGDPVYVNDVVSSHFLD